MSLSAIFVPTRMVRPTFRRAPSMSARAVIAIIAVRLPQAAAAPTLFATVNYQAIGKRTDCPGSFSTPDVRKLKPAFPIVSISVASGSGPVGNLGRESALSLPAWSPLATEAIGASGK